MSVQEVVSQRTKYSKTYKKEDGSFTKEIFNRPIHYEQNGELQEIGARLENAGSTVVVPNRYDEISIDKTPYCGELTVSSDGFEVTINITPVVDTVETVDEPLQVDGNKAFQKATPNSDFGFEITEDQVKVVSEITAVEDVPQQYAFHIQSTGLTAVESDERIDEYHKKWENGELVKERQKFDDYPDHIKFVNDDGDEQYRFQSPVWINNAGEQWRERMDATIDGGTVYGTFKPPATGWLLDSFEHGAVTLDPSFDSTYTYVDDGDTTSHTVSEDNISFSNETVTWRGQQSTSTTSTYYTNTDSISLSARDSGTTSTTFPSQGSPQSVFLRTGNSFSDGDLDSVTADVSNSNFGTDNVTTGPHTNGGGAQAIVDPFGVSGPFGTTSHNTDYVKTDGGEALLGGGGSGKSEATSKETNTTTTQTQDPSVAINGTTYTGPSVVDDNTTATISVGSFQEGSNSFSHSINGSNEAEFKFSYDFTYNQPSAPSSLSASATKNTAGEAEVSLSWSASDSSTDEYRVYRSTSSGVSTTSANQVGTVTGGTTSFTDTTVGGGTTYYYVVTAYRTEGGGLESTSSNEVSTTTPVLPFGKLLINGTIVDVKKINVRINGSIVEVRSGKVRDNGTLKSLK